MNNSSSDSLLSILLSSLGWIFLVVISAFFFLFAKPQYYQQGAKDQHQVDIETVDSALNIVDVVDAIPAVVRRKLDGKLVVESTLRPANPLRALFPRVRDVILTESTQYLDRTAKTQEQYTAEVAAAGGDPQGIAPFIETAGSLDNINEGDEILIVPTEVENVAYLQTMTAHQIIRNITPQPDLSELSLPQELLDR